MGLFGLTTFTVQRRTKEIGVRKVLGATTPGILLLLYRDFGRLFLVSLSQRVRRKQRRLDSEGELNHVAFFHLDCSFVIPDCRGFSTGTPHARTGWNQPITVSISSSD